MFRPLMAVLASLSLVLAVASQPRKSRVNTAALVLESMLLGASLVWLAQRLDAAGLTHFGQWFSGN